MVNHGFWHVVAIATASIACVASCSGSASPGATPSGEAGTSASSGGGNSSSKGNSKGSDASTACGAPGDLCANGESCKTGENCTSTACQAGMCVPVSCTEPFKNGMETDVGCGGGQCAPCTTGKTCLLPRDCESDVCKGGTCQAPTDTDGVKNDSETDVDCGGALLLNGMTNTMSDGAPACVVGKDCVIGPDCTTGVCASGPVLINNLDAGPGVDATVIPEKGKLTCQPATANDGVKNDSETDVDCGGGFLSSGMPNTMSDGAPPCGSNQACVLATDCISLVCTSGKCVAANATDGVKNDSETDTDCGGSLLSSGAPNPASDGAQACADGKNCNNGSDCVDLVCAPGVVGADAGMPSADGGPIDCSSGMGCTCQKASDTDGVKNASETDIDCGGGFLSTTMGGGANTASDGAPTCQPGQNCLLGTDCSTGVCNNNMNTGGPPIDCPAGDTCQCQIPSPTDGVQNDGETDVDCGGGTSLGSDGAPGCATGQKCNIGPDCANLVCGGNGLCAAPVPTDHVQNDSETDVDCGGALLAGGAKNTASDGAPPCADAKTCAIDLDCLSGFCSTITHTCVAGQSCKGLITPAPIQDISAYADTTVNGKDAQGVPDPNGNNQSAGLDTCGPGEATDPIGIQQHESCCKSLPIPNLPSCSSTKPCPMSMQVCSSTTTATGTCQLRMDKYEATAGRVRQFIESVNAWSVANMKGPYNLQAWVKAQLAAPMTPIGVALAGMIPTSGATDVVQFYANADGTTSGPTYLNIVAQLGGTTIDDNHPSGVQGCFTGVGDAGSSTYWWPSSQIASVGSPPRPFTQDYYDIKSQNCAPYWIGAAFCAWDGGRLPTQAESNAVYGGAAYPWGGTLYPNPYPGNTAILAHALTADDAIPVPVSLAIFIPGNPLVANTPGYTINFWNANLGAPTGLGNFYFYPSYPLSNPMNGPLGMDAVPDTLGNDLDLSPYIAAPGRFILDVTSAKSPGTTEGWADYGANMMEYLYATSLTGNVVANYTDTADKPASVLQASMVGILWEGGSWEGHGIQPGGYNEAIQTQYSKAGFRCVRPPEP